MRRLRLTFLGTRGGIAIRSPGHHRHSSLLVQHGRTRIMIDCGLDWLHSVNSLLPTAIVLTHAHPDHAAGLAQGAPCPVYATSETWALIGRFPIRDRRAMSVGRVITIDHLRFRAFPVEHSRRAPAVGLRICLGESCLVYAPDVAEIPDRPRPLRRIELYIGDGATVRRPMVRRRNGALVGHAPIATQLDWCEKAGVRQAIFTHCGSPIVRGNAAETHAIVRNLGVERGIDAQIAVDRLQLCLGAPSLPKTHRGTRRAAPRTKPARGVLGSPQAEVDTGGRA